MSIHQTIASTSIGNLLLAQEPPTLLWKATDANAGGVEQSTPCVMKVGLWKRQARAHWENADSSLRMREGGLSNAHLDAVQRTRGALGCS